MHFGLERAKLAFERAGFDQKLGGTLALGLDAELETFAPRFNFGRAHHDVPILIDAPCQGRGQIDHFGLADAFGGDHGPQLGQPVCG
jgi:hypothetical protein